ncbi:uncharacterized protein isoform X2 [Leptinotarsa decemlineata]
MDLELKLLDHLKLTHKLSRNFACGYSDDDRIFVVNDVGMYILSLNGSVTYEFPSFACKKKFFSLSDYAPCRDIDLNINSFHPYISIEELYKTFMNMERSGKLKHALPAEASPVCAEWSPQGLVGGTDCMLAVLTNLGSLEIYMKFLDENEITQYCVTINITQEIVNLEKVNWKDALKFSMRAKMEEFMKRVDSVVPSAFAWSHLLKVDKKCAAVIFSAVKNKHILAWLVLERDADPNITSKPLFLGKYRTQLELITKMYWHETDEYEGVLFFSNAEGKLNFVHVSDLDKDKVQFNQEQFLYIEPDSVPFEKITVMIYENNTYIITAKEGTLIVYGVDGRGKFFDRKHFNIKGLFVSGIHHIKNKIFVLSIKGMLTQLTLSIQEEHISLEEKIITLKFDAVKYRLHGLFFSRNSVICGVLAYPLELKNFGKTLAYVNIFIYHNTLVSPLELLWNNETGSLEHFWDCFEVLRLNCLKEKYFPFLGLPSDLNYDTLSLPKLKTLRVIAKLSEMVFKKVRIVKSYDLKPYVLLHYLVEIKLVVNRMRRLLKLLSSGQKLSEFQMRSIFIQNIFLKEMVVKDILPKSNVGNTFIEDIMSVMELANELKYPEPMDCIWCGEKILGPSCLPPHVDSRCSITMMPISIIPMYKCPHCKALGHKEVKKEQNNIFCVYCDIPMEKIIHKEEYEELKEAKSECFKDCLNENIEFDEIEENECEYVIFTDSEDEEDDENQSERLRELYKQFSKSSLEEIVKSEVLRWKSSGETL